MVDMGLCWCVVFVVVTNGEYVHWFLIIRQEILLLCEMNVTESRTIFFVIADPILYDGWSTFVASSINYFLALDS